MNVFGIGLPEMGLIFVIALLVFGPKKLPEIGSSLGKAIRGFQDASREFENEFKRETSKAQKNDSVKMNAQLEPSSSETETVSQEESTEQSKVNS
ncbi:TatA/E family twin arginine-targeting protein translocase [Dactylococcopsis salina]|uniref:Sec-independent protein translocase protein TatA n=1 Tax=Dactylococcopsis salina (strain PCC 8305) TaxID=13035 RepID=K9YX58_DACS8|nr:TatA/E family twin arginine-targeting protein translocase [Dactylococcopsis salina]AFZ51097.1 twin arginine-targeting protein translocase, TatA/E family [Dactylococcopsis salina PCC 8305]